MTPKIDKRNYENLLEEMKASIPTFLPDRWKPADGSPDMALIKIYAHMAGRNRGQAGDTGNKSSSCEYRYGCPGGTYRK